MTKSAQGAVTKLCKLDSHCFARNITNSAEISASGENEFLTGNGNTMNFSLSRSVTESNQGLVQLHQTLGS